MATTFEAIATVTVGSGGAADITFSSIPATYTDLLLKVSARDSRNNNPYNELGVAFNGSATYSRRILYGVGSSAGSTSDSTGNWLYNDGNTASSSVFSNAELYIPNYTSSNNKSISADVATEDNGTGNALILTAGLATLTSAITSITLTPNLSFSFLQYSTATLYGIKNS
jgi:hypothetical protein